MLSVRGVRGFDLATAPCLNCAADYFERRCSQSAHGFGHGCDRDCNCHIPVGQTVGGSFQSSNHPHLLPAGKSRVLGCMVLCNRAVLRRVERCRPRQIFIARSTCASCGTLRSHGAWYVWKRRRFRCRTDDLLHPDERRIVHYESERAGLVHRVFCRSVNCDVLHIRSTAVWHEHEPGTNFWLGTPRQPLARAMDLFHSSGARHAGRWTTISSSPRWRPSQLRQTSPRQPRTVHLSSCTARGLERSGKCRVFSSTCRGDKKIVFREEGL